MVLEGRGALGARDGKVALYLSPNRALLGHPPNDPIDFVEHIAVPLPMLVIAEMIGVPHAAASKSSRLGLWPMRRMSARVMFKTKRQSP